MIVLNNWCAANTVGKSGVAPLPFQHKKFDSVVALDAVLTSLLQPPLHQLLSLSLLHMSGSGACDGVSGVVCSRTGMGETGLLKAS